MTQNKSSKVPAEAWQHLKLAHAYRERRLFRRALRECRSALRIAPGWVQATELRDHILQESVREEDAQDPDDSLLSHNRVFGTEWIGFWVASVPLEAIGVVSAKLKTALEPSVENHL